VVTLNFPLNYPQTAPECIVDLPVAFEIQNWNSNNNAAAALGESKISTLIIPQFKALASQFNAFWDEMDHLHANAWVLEPERPSLSICMRRIGIGNHSSMQFEINPLNPRSIPMDIRFLGADSIIMPLRSKIHERAHLWNAKDVSLIDNLQVLLDMQFPKPKSTGGAASTATVAAFDEEEFSVECGICYAYRLAESIPDKVCDNPKCCRPFHSSCLVEWLRAIPTTKQSFDTLFGSCPYCSESITVKLVRTK